MEVLHINSASCYSIETIYLMFIQLHNSNLASNLLQQLLQLIDLQSTPKCRYVKAVNDKQ